MAIEPSSRKYVKNPDVGLREEDTEGGLLFNPDNGAVKILNPTGIFIWKLCNGQYDLDAIVHEIQESFDEVPLEQVRQDVEEFLDTMVTSGLIGFAVPGKDA